MTEQNEYTHIAMYLGISVRLQPDTRYKKYHEWMILSDNPETFNTFDAREVDVSWTKDAILFVFGSKNLITATPGNIYKLTSKGKGSWTKTSEFIGKFPIKEYRQQLHMRHHMLMSEYDERTRKTKNMKRNEVFDLLEPIREVYQDASVSQRVQILAYIIRKITS